MVNEAEVSLRPAGERRLAIGRQAVAAPLGAFEPALDVAP